MQITEQLSAAISENVSAALLEDLGNGDLTAQLIAENASAKAIVVGREPMTVSGQPWVNEVFRQLDSDVSVEWMCNDGDRIPAAYSIRGRRSLDFDWRRSMPSGVAAAKIIA